MSSVPEVPGYLYALFDYGLTEHRRQMSNLKSINEKASVNVDLKFIKT